MYEPGYRVDVNSNQVPQDVKEANESDGDMEMDFSNGGLNGGNDAKYSGFCRTDRQYRVHYRLARKREQMKAKETAAVIARIQSKA